ncbi:MAG: PRC-barrel domain-containing protein [Thermoproteota archaeon]
MPEEAEKKSIPRSKLIGMPVYNPDGYLVGNVQDLGVIPGQQNITLITKTKYGTVVDIPWGDVGQVGDIVILSKAVKIEVPTTPVVTQPTTAAPTTPVPVNCPKCGKPATYIQQYQRYYCYTCKKYI